jgi:iron complex outermembrane receptor protein
MKTHVFRSALTPVSAAALLLMAHSAVLAQNANASANAEAAAASDGDQKLETVVITGSRIRGIAPVGAVVNSLTRENIETSGATTTAQLVQQLPQVFNLGVSENSRGQPGGSTNITYGASINLRGIGPYATLVLVNGHRVVGQGTTGSAVDPSILPTLALDRVEIVADGASALYGSDAIAGVANLIMRRNEKGVQAYARFGVGDAFHERQLGGLAGLRWDGGNATFTYEKTHRSALNGGDRDFF